MPAPKLEAHCGSWVIIHKMTGKPIMETFRQSTADKWADTRDDVEVLSTLAWLGRYSAAVKLAGGQEPTKEQLDAVKLGERRA